MPVYKSPTTSARDIDFKSVKTTPTGTPCLFIASSRRGPAFVPVPLGNFNAFITAFGNVDADRFGPIAVRRWLVSGTQPASFIRLLGCGDGKERIDTGENAGRVNHAGYVVGQDQVQDNGMLGPNTYATQGGPAGRSYVLGCFMSESNSNIFSDAGLQTTGENKALPIVRGVLFAASGVHLALNTEATAYNEPSTQAFTEFGASKNAGLSFGDVLVKDGERSDFIVILNGHKPTTEYPNSITASFQQGLNAPEGVKSIEYAFNTDPFKIEQAGHYLKQFYDVSEKFASITGSMITSHVDTTSTEVKTDGENYKLYQAAFLLTSSLDRNKGSNTKVDLDVVGVPNLENYENRYCRGFSPFVVSQKLDGKNRDLFRFHSLDDGSATFGSFKFTIANIEPKGELSISPYPTFDLHIRKFGQSDKQFQEDVIEGASSDGIHESYHGLDLDPSSDNFIAKRIGDMNIFYDFDNKHRESQKVVKDGRYPNISNLVRVEVADEVHRGEYKDLVPFGFRGLHHMVTSGSTETSSILTGTADAPAGSEGSLSSKSGISQLTLRQINQPPAPMRESLFTLNDLENPEMSYTPTWGFQSEEKFSPENPNTLETNLSSSLSFLSYLPDFHISHQNFWVGNNQGQSDVGGAILDSDRYNNNFFAFDKIEVLTASDTGFPHNDYWHRSTYRRDGRLVGVLKKLSDDLTGEVIFENSRFIKPEDFKDPDTRQKLSFTFPMQGGFDGLNIFDKDKTLFTNNAVMREFEDPAQGTRKGPTISAYKTANKILEDKIAAPGNILFTPGLRDSRLTSEFLETCSDRFSTFYIMDLENKDNLNQTMTGSELGPFSSPQEEFEAVTSAVKNTRINFDQSMEDNSFGACYFPDIIIEVEIDGIEQSMQVPPSVAVASIYSSNSEFERPIGIQKGVLEDGAVATFQLNDKEYDEFYQSGINVISSDPQIPDSGPFMRSQRTLQKEGVGSRIAVRRMLIAVRRIVGTLMRQNFLFEKNSRLTSRRAKSEIENALVKLRGQRAFKSYSVEIDSTSGTINVANNTVTGDLDSHVLKGRVKIIPRNSSEAVIIDLEEAADDAE